MIIGEDARKRQIQLTTAGKKAFKTAVPLWQEVQNEFVNKLGLDRRAQLKDMLTELTAEGEII